MRALADTTWVLVAGGFHERGGMDRANAALAIYLLDGGAAVHLVGHDIDASVIRRGRAVVHRVPRPRGMPLLAERMLDRTGRSVAAAVTAADPGARVVVNGGNCRWPDINWVHAVHAAWPVRDDGSPCWSRWRNRRLKRAARQREAAALSRARIVVANSQTTAAALAEHTPVDPRVIRTIYLGSEPGWDTPDPLERGRARAALGVEGTEPVVLFVGALGSDINKGFDVLWGAWDQLVRGGAWDARLVVAGAGWRVAEWRRQAERSRASGGVRFLGFTSDMHQVLAAGDLLVSPVRYEAYGLNVHEALCRGVPVMVSAAAGVVERFEPEMRDAILPSQVTPEALALRLQAWRRDMDGWRSRAAATAERLRARTWRDMAAEFVEITASPPARAVA